MLRLGGAVILMLKSFNDDSLEELSGKIRFFAGSMTVLKNMQNLAPLPPFCDACIDFLNELSKQLMSDREAKKYPDVITFGFWIRKSSLLKYRERFTDDLGRLILGRGTIFHIAPSNVPVNYMYSLAAGLITGNANIVRIPSKDFPQISIINRILCQVLESEPVLRDYICLIRYDRDQKINDFLSQLADVRVIWGGDNTIAEIRKSPMKPRATEITFADRYSFAIIDSDMYLDLDDKVRFAEKFYNDTFLTDQNACTSPQLIVWTGNKKEEAKKLFWEYEHELVKQKYSFQAIMGINKLAKSYMAAVKLKDSVIAAHEDNYIIRVQVPRLNTEIMDLRDNSGFFYEYDCDNLLDLRVICNEMRTQTIGFLGDLKTLTPLLQSGIKGVDRIVPIGETMDFDLLWDGYNLFERLTRTVNILV